MGNAETKETRFARNNLNEKREKKPAFVVDKQAMQGSGLASSLVGDTKNYGNDQNGVTNASLQSVGGTAAANDRNTVSFATSENTDIPLGDTSGTKVALNDTKPSRVPAAALLAPAISEKVESGVESGVCRTFPGAEILNVTAHPPTYDPAGNESNPSRSTRFRSLLREEIEMRNSFTYTLGATGKGGVYNVIGTSIINLLAAFSIFALYLVSLESLLSIALSVGLTIYTYNETKDDASYKGGIMSWILLTFAVVTPLSTAIGMAFTRRDNGLTQIAEFKATVINLFSVHACWDWCNPSSSKPTGRAASSVDWLDHTDQVLHTLFQISSQLTRLLTLPTAGRARHHVFRSGQRQRDDIEVIARKLRRSILQDMWFLTNKCELLKREGLPPNEATRVRQWERIICQAIEKLLVVKKYRTPQALRTCGRLFTVFLTPLYAPYYGQMAIDLNSLGMAIAFAVVTSLSLTSLFECVSQLEDPFDRDRLDGINVEAELRDEFLVDLVDIRDYHFPDAPPFEANVLIPITKRGPQIRLFQAS